MRSHLARSTGAEALEVIVSVIIDAPFLEPELTNSPIGSIRRFYEPPLLSDRRVGLHVGLAAWRTPRGAHNAPLVLVLG